MTFVIIKIHLLVFVILLILNTKLCGVVGQPQVPCFFIFGDSLVDPGNNNLLLTLSKANYRPYGIDFPNTTVTGRFTNGRTIVDIIAQLLGFENFIPRFVGVSNDNILNGVNYGSAAAGIRRETGSRGGDRFNLDAQLRNHRTIVERIRTLLGSGSSASSLLNQCIYTVGLGSNDYINNYYMPQFYLSSSLFTPQQYAIRLVQEYSRQLTSLYNEGARKVALFGVGQLGFTPYGFATYGNTTSPTVVDVNNAVELFNIGLRALVVDLNANLTGANFTFLNTTAIATAGTIPGVTFLTTPCCTVSTITNFTCVPFTPACADRSMYAFYDNIHPSEVVNVVFGNQYFQASSPSFVHPYDISTLAAL